jgi:transposase
MFLDAATELLALPGLIVIEVNLAPENITITARPDTPSALCPLCDGPSQRVHSTYTRKVADLPWGRRTITLWLEVRRFFCDTTTCVRRIFTERLPQAVAPYARRTKRLHHTLQALAFELGGEVGARVARWLRYGHPSPDTLLRLLRRADLPTAPTPRCLGVDDWAMKKGRTYGTLLCDLERRQVVDLLPSRDGPALAEWLQTHPGVEIITRDRAGAYAEGAKQGAPTAIQVADRFHLLTNLSGAIKQLLERHPDALKLPAPQPASSTTVFAPPPAEIPASTPMASLPAGLQRSQSNYDAVQALHQQGHTIRAIADQLHLATNTVNKYIHLPHPPDRQRRSTRKMIGYEALVHQRWNEGLRRPKPLFTELKDAGFSGSYQTVARYVAVLRGPRPAAQASSAPVAPAPQLTVSQGVRLLLLPPDQLSAEQQNQLAHLQQASEHIARAYELAHRFQDLVRKRLSEELPGWMRQVHESQIPSLCGFATGLKRDLAAVTAALSFAWSNGQTEGHINRLKQIKRQMYGRGKLDLLKRRVMHYDADP